MRFFDETSGECFSKGVPSLMKKSPLIMRNAIFPTNFHLNWISIEKNMSCARPAHKFARDHGMPFKMLQRPGWAVWACTPPPPVIRKKKGSDYYFARSDQIWSEITCFWGSLVQKQRQKSVLCRGRMTVPSSVEVQNKVG